MTMQLTADLAGPLTTSTGFDDVPFPSAQLLEMIRADADAADERASLGQASFERMRSEGLFHLLVPPELGGAGGTPRHWFDATLAVAHADASAGWIVAQAAVQNAWLAVASDDRFAREYFATKQTIASSGAARVPATLADDVPGSETYVVQGARWPYVSGCVHADYVGGMVVIAGPEGVVETRLVLQPIGEATIRPTWDTLGLRASASHDVDLGEHMEVPAWRTFTWPDLTVARPGVLANATTTVAMISCSAAAVMLGAARRALEVAVLSAEQKRRPLEKLPLVEQAPFVRGFAGLHGRLDLATAGLRHLLNELWNRAGDGEAPDAIGRARLRLAAADAVTTGAEVVRIAALLVGADATHRTHPLERLTRDSQMLVHHVSVNAPSQERLGAVLLGSYRGPAGLI
jgi:alkylation response protein AidB-like acyl-CoA dehydrogenase